MPVSYVSTERVSKLEINGNADLLLVRGFTVTEALSQIPVVRLELMVANAKAPVDFSKLVGETAKLRLAYRDDSLDQPRETRTFTGILRSLAQGPQGPEFTAYRAELVPKAWALSQRVECRSFEKQSYGDIVKKLLMEEGIVATVPAILRQYEVRWTCQYEESILDYVSRILEQEGVAYYFDPLDWTKIVLAYDSHEFQDLRGAATLSCEDDVESWERCQSVRPTGFEVTDWSYKTSRSNSGSSAARAELPPGQRRVYEYPLPLENPGHAGRMADVRLDEARSDRVVYRGRSFRATLAPGQVFRLEGHFSDNGRYLIVAVTHTATSGTDFRSGEAAEEWYQNEFLCIPDGTKFRPPRVTPRPRIHGVQPAIVTNITEDPEDKATYCRVKVKFAWGMNAPTPIQSDWLRVAQPWASSGWGFQFQPRVNDEVLVAFENGDPDRAIVVGSVYDFMHQAPWPKTWQVEAAGIRSQGGNELVFFDKKQLEVLKLYAKKEHQLLVDESSYTEVKGDRHETVRGEHRELVTKNLSLQGEQNVDVKSALKYAVQAGTEIHLKSNLKLVLEAGAQISLKAGSSSIDISPGGISIQGPLVRLNSGGAAASGSGSSPQRPELPKPPGTRETSSTSSSGSGPNPGSGSQQGSGGGSPASGRPSPALSSPVVQQRMAAPSFRKLLQGIADIFSPKKSPKETPPPPVTTGLGLAVDEMVAKSPTLTRNLEALQADGWTIEYGEAGKGSYCDRNAKKIVVDEGGQGDTAGVVQTLAHESGHARYTPDPYVPPDGLTKDQYVTANVARDLRDEGEATITNLKVRDELLAAGQPDIGVAGAKAAEYQHAYDACDDPDDPGKRDALRTQIGNIFKDGEHPSTDPSKTYGEYYGEPYARHYDEVKK